ncbi:hypothetical protein HAX54_053460 [Datura stramonium]|uniref:Uncharacterized protein n=1 Tax=Datura stramonium TaxID=4076 RepID=A0ABS8T1F6_DATST|nr:hypothetical protein [Datura stramonium]
MSVQSTVLTAAVQPTGEGERAADRDLDRAADRDPDRAATNLNNRDVPLKSMGRPTGEAADARRKKKSSRSVTGKEPAPTGERVKAAYAGEPSSHLLYWICSDREQLRNLGAAD